MLYSNLYKNHNYQLDNSGNPITEDAYHLECGVLAQQVRQEIPELAYCVNGEEHKEVIIKNYKKDTSGNNIL